jgi:hypothetical protein
VPTPTNVFDQIDPTQTVQPDAAGSAPNAGNVFDQLDPQTQAQNQTTYFEGPNGTTLVRQPNGKVFRVNNDGTLGDPNTPDNTAPAASPMVSLGAGLNDIWQGAQWLGHKAEGMIPGMSDAADQAEAQRLAQQQAANSAYMGARAQAGQTGVDWGRLGGNVVGTLPVGGLVSTPVKLLAGGAEALGLGTEASGLAGWLTRAASAIENPGAASTVAGKLTGSTIQGGAAGAVLGGAQGNATGGALAGAGGGAASVPLSSLLSRAGVGATNMAQSALSGDATQAVKNIFSNALAKAQGVSEESASAPLVDGINTPASTPSGVVNQSQINQALASKGLNAQSLPKEALDDMANEAAKQQQVTGSIDADQLARRTNLIVNGVQPTKAMLTRDPQQWLAEQDAAQDIKGQPIKQAYIQANQAIANRLDQMGQAPGANLPEDAPSANYALGQQLDKAITKQWDQTGKVVSDAYNQVRDTVGGNVGLVPTSLNDALANFSDRSQMSPWVNDFQKIMAKSQAPDGSLTVNQADELRKQINNIGDNSRTGDYFRTVVRSALDNDVINTGGDQFADARALAAQRFQDFSSPATQKIINEQATPEKLFDNIVKSGSIDDLKQMTDLLGRTPEGTQALNMLQQRTADHIANQATAADGSIKPAALQNVLFGQRGIGIPKIQAIFGDQGLNSYKSINQAAQDALQQPMGVSTAATPNPSGSAYTAQRLAQMGVKTAVQAKLAVLPEIVSSAAKGAYEGIKENMANKAATQFAKEATSGTAYTPSAIKQAGAAKAALEAQQAASARQAVGRFLQGPLTVAGAAAANAPQQGP